MPTATPSLARCDSEYRLASRPRALPYGRCDHRAMGHAHALQEQLREPARALRRAIPGVYDGYRQMHAAAYASGALD